MNDASPRLLIVEDDPDIGALFRTFFDQYNCEIAIAQDGATGLRLAAEQTFDLALLDIQLPDMDGYEVCQALRAQRRTQHLPIIFLTARTDRNNKLHGLELGVVDYITKPFDSDELWLRVRNALRRSAQAASLNPVTGLPEGALLEQRLASLLKGDDAWALILLTLRGLPDLSETAGFVAADEVRRAITLMARNAARDAGDGDEALYQLGEDRWLLVTQPERVEALSAKLDKRVRQTLPYFQPAPELAGAPAAELDVTTETLTRYDEIFAGVDELMARLLALAD